MLRPSTLCNYLFTGLTMLIPVLFILRVEKLKPRLLNQEALVVAFNITLLFTTLGFGAIYFAEFFIAFYSGVEYDQYAFVNRATGAYWYSFWIPISINMLLPQLIWFKAIRKSVWITYNWFILTLILSLCINFITNGVSFSPTISSLYYIISVSTTLALLTILYFIILNKTDRQATE